MVISIRVMIAVGLILLISCNNIREKNSSGLESDQKSISKPIANPKDTVQDVANKMPINTTDCLPFIRELIAGSSLKNDIPGDFVVLIDDSTKSSYSLKIANRHEETGDEIAIKLITLDFVKKQLLDYTNDADAPMPLKFDKKIFEEAVSCLGK
jgi:hypothetical protein